MKVGIRDNGMKTTNLYDDHRERVNVRFRSGELHFSIAGERA